MSDILQASVRFWLLLACAVCLSFLPPSSPRVRRYYVPRVGEMYGLTVSVMAPEAFAGREIGIAVDDAEGLVASKRLRENDIDFYVTVKPRRAGELSVHLYAAPALLDAAKVKVEFSSLSVANPMSIAAHPNDTAKTAQNIEAGGTVFGANDGEDASMQWFRFTSRESGPVPFRLEASTFAEQSILGVSNCATGLATRSVQSGESYCVNVTVTGSVYRLRSEGVNLPSHPAAKARTEHLDQLLADLPSAPVSQVKRILNESGWVLAREMAAEVLGKLNARDEIPALERALGDPSKLVQKAAARALREMDAAPAVQSALRSGNGRVRLGGLLALQQDFHSLTARVDLLPEVKAALHDAVPQNRILAAHALSSWYE